MAKVHSPAFWPGALRILMVIAYGACLLFSARSALAQGINGIDIRARIATLEQRVHTIERHEEETRAAERLARLEENTKMILKAMDHANNTITMLAIGICLMLAEGMLRYVMSIRNGRKRDV